MTMSAHPDADLTPEQTQVLGDQLAENRQELIDTVESHRDTIVSKHDCDILDAGDSASHNEEHHRAPNIVRRHRETIAEIDAALDRLRDGRFGISETTGEPIAYKRLLAIPWARTDLAPG